MEQKWIFFMGTYCIYLHHFIIMRRCSWNSNKCNTVCCVCLIWQAFICYKFFVTRAHASLNQTQVKLINLTLSIFVDKINIGCGKCYLEDHHWLEKSNKLWWFFSIKYATLQETLTVKHIFQATSLTWYSH